MNDSIQLEYAKFVETRFKEMGSRPATLMHAAIGISGEAGEILDAVKKTWVYNAPLDVANVKEELGDILFYIQKLLNIHGWRMEEIMLANMDKLKKRYPNGYTDKAARERADKLPNIHPLTGEE